MKLNRKRRRHYNSKRKQVLVLDHSWKCINTYDYEDALVDWANGRATILHTYDDFRIRSGRNSDGERTVDMLCPSVIVMNPSESKFRNKTKYKNMYDSHKVDYLPCTRRNIYERDNGRCAYCDREITFSQFTVDHVYPESKGGLYDWYNVRASCFECNNEKDDKTLSELGWKLKRRVGIPTLTESVPKNIIYHMGGRIPHESWRPYIYWEVKVKEKIRDDVEHVKRDGEITSKKDGRKTNYA